MCSFFQKQAKTPAPERDPEPYPKPDLPTEQKGPLHPIFSLPAELERSAAKFAPGRESSAWVICTVFNHPSRRGEKFFVLVHSAISQKCLKRKVNLSLIADDDEEKTVSRGLLSTRTVSAVSWLSDVRLGRGFWWAIPQLKHLNKALPAYLVTNSVDVKDFEQTIPAPEFHG